MKKGILIILIVIIPVFMPSCELDNSLEKDLPEGENIPMLEAYLVEGEKMEILFFSSTTMQEPVRINMIWNSSAYIISGVDSIKLRNLVKADYNTGFLYNYISDSIVNPGEGEYSVYIEKEGYKPVKASSRLPGEVIISGLEYDNEMLTVRTANLRDDCVNYYLLRMTGFSDGTLNAVEQALIDMHEKPEGNVSISYPFTGDGNDSTRVDLYRIDSTAYDYHRSIINALGANRDAFTTPSPFRGNVENAWGIFTCTTKDSRTIVY
ncbi:MAG: DUF4249 domain-containing protein [Bacteroidales bacterium]|nr:DUF4249 domain-containing protein [Bacteroidales bacterium]